MGAKITTCAAIALAISAVPAVARERITTEEGYLDRVAGRTVTAEEGNTVVSHPVGRVTGRWEWHSGFRCRKLRVGGNESGTDCQLVELCGDQLGSTREQGQGRVTVGTLD